MMNAENQSHSTLLGVEAERGQLNFAGQRVLVLDAAALWALRGELFAIAGGPSARRALTQFGFLHGWLTAGAVERVFARSGNEGWKHAALPVLASQGHFTAPSASDELLSEAGATLTGSFEAEQHRLERGPAPSPVCWTLCGLLSGYLSRAEGREIYVLEDRCGGRGDGHCHFLAKTREDWGEDRAEQLQHFDAQRIARLRAGLGAEPGADTIPPPERPALSELDDDDDVTSVVAASSAMAEVLDLTRRVAVSEATVLITGESGVGKERIARLLHDWSPRSRGPFVAVNCGALTETLLDSELFGHARGAFTGATRDRPGLFEAASGGTLLLDEIGDVSPFMQVKLLRALQEREIRRVGENTSRSVDVRVLGATNQDLTAAVRSGEFRADLYYRLKVVELHIPPLRARVDDIMALARTLLGGAARRMKRKIDGFSPPAAAILLGYSWPGNVRELENIIERAVALSMGDRVEVEDLPEEVRCGARGPAEGGGQELSDPAASSSREVRPLREIERDYILASLEQNNGNQAHTAEQLEIGSATLYRKLKRYGALSKDRN